MTAMFARPKMDARLFKDERSRGYPIRPYVQGAIRATVVHEIPTPLPLNQGSEGACVGFGWSGQLAVGPIFNPTTQLYAQAYYQAARDIDARAGRYYAEGATVLAGAEVARQRGLIRAYRWAFGIEDVIATIVAKGPVVLGLNWYDSMYNTEPNGIIRINGPLVGGHCILATGYIHQHKVWGGNWIQLLNSWGSTYGVNGVGYIREMDLAYLLAQHGEACIADEIAPVPRRPWWYKYIRTITSPFRMDD